MATVTGGNMSGSHGHPWTHEEERVPVQPRSPWLVALTGRPKITRNDREIDESSSPVASNEGAKLAPEKGEIDETSSPVASNEGAKLAPEKGEIDETSSPMASNEGANLAPEKGEIDEPSSPVASNEGTKLSQEERRSPWLVALTGRAKISRRKDGEIDESSSPVASNEVAKLSLEEGETDKTSSPVSSNEWAKLSGLERGMTRMKLVEKTNFVCIENIRGRPVNLVDGLELYKNVFSKVEQNKLIDFVYACQQQGREGRLCGRTYSEPRKWMPGKGRVTMQFGCCYNYAVDSNGNPPGIMHHERVDPLPPLLIQTIRQLIKSVILPEWCVPDSCIINIYEVGDCIPPHIDHHDFVRPFCTLSLLSECSILFGSRLRIVGDGLFDGPLSIPLPVGSVLVLKGNGADVAKHAVPGVPTKRISITFRKMDPRRVPQGYRLPRRVPQGYRLPEAQRRQGTTVTPSSPPSSLKGADRGLFLCPFSSSM